MQDYSLGTYVAPRLREHHALLRRVLGSKPSGTALEFGVGRGHSLKLISQHMPAVGFDSGQGLPEDWRPEFPKGSFADGIPAIRNAAVLEGWFDELLPAIDFTTFGPVGLVHIDCDLYSSTATALRHIEPLLTTSDTYVVFDEWHGYDGCEDHEQRAWREFADRTLIDWTVIGHSFEQWAIRIV